LLICFVRPRKSKSESEDYPAVRCSIYVFENEKPTPAQVFRDCARHYWLQTTTGKSLGEICDHNAVVASNAGRNLIATIWRVVKLLFGFSGLELTSTSAVASVGSNRPTTVSREESEPGDSGIKDASTRPSTRHQSGNVSFPNQQATQQSETLVNGSGSNNSNSAPTSNSNERGVSDTSGGVSEEAESEVEDIDSQVKGYMGDSRCI
jgi:hypothetical protein